MGIWNHRRKVSWFHGFTVSLVCFAIISVVYSRSSPNGHSCQWRALLTFLYSSKWPAPVMDTFFASGRCPLKRASSVV